MELCNINRGTPVFETLCIQRSPCTWSVYILETRNSLASVARAALVGAVGVACYRWRTLLVRLPLLWLCSACCVYRARQKLHVKKFANVSKNYLKLSRNVVDTKYPKRNYAKSCFNIHNTGEIIVLKTWQPDSFFSLSPRSSALLPRQLALLFISNSCVSAPLWLAHCGTLCR